MMENGGINMLSFTKRQQVEKKSNETRLIQKTKQSESPYLLEITLECIESRWHLSSQQDYSSRQSFQFIEIDIIYSLLQNYTVILSADRSFLPGDSDIYCMIKELNDANLLPDMLLYFGSKKSLRYALFPHFNKNMVMNLITNCSDSDVPNYLHMYAVSKNLLANTPAEEQLQKLLEEKLDDFCIVPAGDGHGLIIEVNQIQLWEEFLLPTIQIIADQYALKLNMK